MTETMILIGGRSNKQGTSLCAGKFGAEYLDVSSTVEMNIDDMTRLGLANGDKVRLTTPLGETVVRCKSRAGKDLAAGIMFIAYGPHSSRLMGADTAGSGMPMSKSLDVEVEVLPTEPQPLGG
jgi:formylmethanofuran dehydrogenase subunit D